MTTSEQRFWAKVDKSGECWEWMGHRWAGYGKAKMGTWNGAHRIAYELLVGRIPVGLEIDHLCRNRGCVNPAHMECVTHAENMQRGGRAIQTHCKHGHEFTPENTRMLTNLKYQAYRRQCIACRREYQRQRRRTRIEAAA